MAAESVLIKIKKNLPDETTQENDAANTIAMTPLQHTLDFQAATNEYNPAKAIAMKKSHRVVATSMEAVQGQLETATGNTEVAQAMWRCL